jgi:hypothetical protein
MEAMRADEITTAAGPKMKGSEEIGLFCQVTTITREGITTRIVHRCFAASACDTFCKFAEGSTVAGLTDGLLELAGRPSVRNPARDRAGLDRGDLHEPTDFLLAAEFPSIWVLQPQPSLALQHIHSERVDVRIVSREFGEHGAVADLFFAGISKTKGPSSFQISTHGFHPDRPA